MKIARILLNQHQHCVCGLTVCVPYHLCPAQISHDSNMASCLAPYQGSSPETLDLMFKAAEFRSGQSIMDIGMGDGRILIKAVQLGAKRAVGWELRESVFQLAQAHLQAALTPEQLSRTEIRLGDAKDCDPCGIDLVTLFLLPSGLLEVSNLLLHKRQSTNSPASFPRTFVSAGWPLPNSHWRIQREEITSGGTRIFVHAFKE